MARYDSIDIPGPKRVRLGAIGRGAAARGEAPDVLMNVHLFFRPLRWR